MDVLKFNRYTLLLISYSENNVKTCSELHKNFCSCAGLCIGTASIIVLF